MNCSPSGCSVHGISQTRILEWVDIYGCIYIHIYTGEAHIYGLPWCPSSKESACRAGDAGLTPESGRCPRGRRGNLLQCSCLENPMDRGAWWSAVHRVAKSRT